MTAKKRLVLYLLTLAVFLLIDALWLGVIAAPLYQAHLAGFLGGGTNWLAAGLFYLLYGLGILHFAVREALQERSVSKAFLSGALFGLFAYATYELTNWATLPGWPFLVVVVDIAWGAVLTGTTAAAVTWLAMRRPARG